MDLKRLCCRGLLLTLACSALRATGVAPTGTTISLDGAEWRTSPDPQNIGRDQNWAAHPRAEAKSTRVPWTFLADFKNYHGVMWYWRFVALPANPLSQGRTLIRFWSVHYKADVWVNGTWVGSHEGADEPFVFDITSAVRPTGANLVAVRVLNPTKSPIDGLVINKLPHRWPTSDTDNFSQGGSVYNYGGILDSVEVLTAPAVRIADLAVDPDPHTGQIQVELAVDNAGKATRGQLELTVAEAATGAIVASERTDRNLAAGKTRLVAQLPVQNFRLWQLNDPQLYRVTARIAENGTDAFDQQSTRCGFRDFRLQNGYFSLNGKRLFLRSAHTGNGAPVGYMVSPPYDPDIRSRDLILAKTMGLNMVRFLAGMATRRQLELADEIGMLIYEESYASWYMENSPQMPALFDRSVSAMVRRDRNHPSVVIWGLLNETPAWEHRHDEVQRGVFEHVVQMLPLVRGLDATRMVLLDSGRFDGHLDIGSVSNPGSDTWEYLLGAEAPGAGRTDADPDYSSRSLVGTGLGYYKGAGDVHIYPALPHSPAAIHLLRTLGQGTKHVWLSEYGYDAALDMTLIARHYDQLGSEDYSSGFFRSGLEKFMRDWRRWDLASVFGRPEDYFQACVLAQAGIRSQGLNAIRSNPNLVGYSLTSLVDGYPGEGLITNFHELKPGMTDAISEGLAPLRWCLFTGEANVYRGRRIKLEAVLADEDVLRPGTHWARMEVYGPQAHRVFTRRVSFAIPDPTGMGPPPLAFPIFAEEVPADWPEGRYRFVATLEDGGPAAGGTTDFAVTDATAMPTVPGPVLLWGGDATLASWLARHGIANQAFASAEASAGPGVILAGRSAPPGEPEAFAGLARAVRHGKTVIFLDPAIFSPGALSALGIKAQLKSLPKIIVIADYWAKVHPVFAGLPAGGLLDYGYYRDIISSQSWQRGDVPAEVIVGGIVSSPRYASGLCLTVDRLGSGRVILNTLNIEGNLATDPAAERLLRNLLRYAAAPAGEP